MVSSFRIIAIDFRIPYKGNNFHNNTDESVNLESLLQENISSILVMCYVSIVMASELACKN